jgi:signal transduction histidine kinase
MPDVRVAARRGLFLLSGMPLGIAWFTLMVTAWSLTLGLAITPVLVPLLYGIGELTRGCAAVEAALARALLGVEVYAPARLPRRRAWWGWALGPVAEPGFWRAQAYLWLRASAGFMLAVLVLSLLAVGLGSITAPLYAGFVAGGLDYGLYTAHDVWQALPLVPLGCAVLLITLQLLKPMASLFSYSAQQLLAGAQAPAAVAARSAAQPRPRPLGPYELGVHAGVSALIATVILLVWALSGARTFWPIWVLMPLALLLAVHAWVQLLRARPSLWIARIDFALAVHAGVWVACSLFLAGIWAAGGGDSFWAAWPILGLGTVLAIHSSVVLVGSRGRDQLSERIDVLTSTRAGALDEQESKLRRIERDLHDGAQARLVALGMSLGLAEQKLRDAEPGAAREHVAEARAGAEQALRELRDLARGIHPPLLADRGLEAAVRSLADLSPLQVSVVVDIAARPSSTVESAAYFVAAEGLANATKHARAERVEVRVRRRAGALRLEIFDDGTGGADAEGSGLRGLRSRVEALDGRLTIVSPPGGPTILTAELPCE